MTHPFFLIFLLTVTAFILLLLVTLSTPVVHVFYFLHADVAGGVRFGAWGYCIDSGSCSPTAFGYTWEPDFITGLVQTLVFYPIATIFTFLASIAIFPSILAIRTRRARVYPVPVFTVLSWLAFLTSLLAFIFMIAIFASAKTQFASDGVSASFGPLPWMSLAATILLAFVAIHGGLTAPSQLNRKLMIPGQPLSK